MQLLRGGDAVGIKAVDYIGKVGNLLMPKLILNSS